MAGASGCDADCRGALVYARQTWLSLGKLAPRVQRVLLGGTGCCDTDYLQREHTGLVTLAPAGTGGSALRQVFPAPQIHTLFVVEMGAYVRLSAAGLSCPDWPGCYGHVSPAGMAEAGKAWKEMIHRYAAATLGALILVLVALAIQTRKERL